MRTDFYSFLAEGQFFRVHRLLPSTHAHGESDENKSAKQESINIVHRRLRYVRMRVETADSLEMRCDTDRQTGNPLTDLAQTFLRTYIHDDKTVYQILAIQLFKFLSYSVRMTSDIQTDRLPFDGFCPKFDRNLQIMFKDHIPNFIHVALIVFELSCSQTDKHNSKIVFYGLREV
ncbi:hypothetical protein AVEN_222887-1 [Araneus ventricosus]|uniref:Uncharacterized protein n=1 Tax=Araneus ventricosus TaxID=182803 RepID=A0A4Y2Q4Z6_ARAVE|nr:hypothetical protein AVEN_222887-1 [Araneus ventricosus]